MNLIPLVLAALTLNAAPKSSGRNDLVEFARIVKFSGDSPDTLQVTSITRGVDGWAAWNGENGEYMIGIEWDEPRDIAEVNIEFRHAIANRETIRVQYWQNHWPNPHKGGWAPLDDPFHGKWVTAKIADWWAGDRDVSLQFAPLNEEREGADVPDVRYRRTYRLRFLLGKEELPPVRYLRAYGPAPVAEAAFEIRFDENSPLKPPFDVSVVNGEIPEETTTTRFSQALKAPVKTRVRYMQGDVETATRTIVTVRSMDDPLQGVSFLPEEAVRSGIIRVPALGVSIVHEGSTQDFEAGIKPGESIMDRVEREPEQTWERARREIPALRKTAQRPEPMYLPLGPPDARQEIGVAFDGSIVLHASALKVPAGDTERLHWPDGKKWTLRVKGGPAEFDQSAEGAVKQSLLEGFLPIVISTWEAGGVRYTQTCVATYLHGDPAEPKGDEPIVLLSRMEMTSTSSASATAAVTMGVMPSEELVLADGQVLATGRAGKKYEKPLHRFMVSGSAGLEPKLAQGADSGNVMRCERTLEPGASAALVVGVSYVTLDEAGQRQMAALAFDDVLHRESERWRRIIAGQATIEVPDALLSDFYKANLAHILITGDRDPFNGTHVLPAATYGYNVCLNESCHQIRSLEMRGLHAEAAKYLEAFLAGQSTMGLHGRFSDKLGVLHGLPSQNGDYQGFRYNLDHGFALWMLSEHYRFTRDRDWLKKNAGALVAACDFITRQRTRPEESDTLARDDIRWGMGLLPPGHLEDPPEWLWWFAVNAYAARGMRATAESLAEIGHPEATRVRNEASLFAEDLRRSCRESMLRAPVVRLRDGTYVPHQPTRSRLRGRDLGWIRDVLYGPVHLIDCGVYTDNAPEAEWILRDTEDNVFIGEERGRKLTDFDSQWFSWGGITLQSNLLPNPLVYLRRGQPKHAVRAFYNSLAANVYEGVRTFTEHPIEAYGIGQGPFFKSPDESAFIVWLRSLLICENGPVLEVLPAAPLEWLGEGKRINVRGAPTWFGPIDLAVTCKGGRMEIDVKAPTRNPPEMVRVHLRKANGITGATVNGTPVPDEDFRKGVFVMRR